MIAIAWLIALLPVLATLIIVFVTWKNQKLSSAVAIVCALIAFFLSLSVFQSFNALQSPFLHKNWSWLSLGELNVGMGVLLDPLSVMMLLIVTLVSLLVQIYSLGYMKGDPGISRFYAYISLFSASMLGLVISNNMLQTYMCWELVGLCSYLLIGFWYQKPEAASAAMKAFSVTRFGDLGFLVGMVMLAVGTGTFNFIEMEQVISGPLNPPLSLSPETFITIAAILIFCGAVGKSAQFPLHIWLPDAMEGPTPVSALIHAATMVAAGIYLVARCFFIFEGQPQAMQTVAVIGGITAFMAATIALVQNDIKKILAYSTISQLGYMIMSLGIAGGYTAGLFHLMTHAFFKALLFLCAGSVIHAVHTQNIWQMGGLSKKMSITSTTCLIGSLAIAGIFPLSGFWSKDAILAAYHSHQTVLFALALIVAFFTAFYMFRLYFVTFHGAMPQDAHQDKAHHAHESPLSMTLPLMVLAFLSIFSGLVGIPQWDAFGHFFHSGHVGEYHAEHASLVFMLFCSFFPVGGIALAWLIYQKQLISAEMLAARFKPVHTLLKNKYYMDEIWGFLLRSVVFLISKIMAWIDRQVIDGSVDLFASIPPKAGYLLRYTQTGQVQVYALVIFLSIVFILVGQRLSIF